MDQTCLEHNTTLRSHTASYRSPSFPSACLSCFYCLMAALPQHTQATKNTMFDQWLEAVTVQPHAPPGAALVTAGARTSSGGCAGAAPGSCLGTGQDALDPEVARYLAPAPGPAAKTGTTVGASGGPSPSPFATAAAAAAYGTAAAGGVFGGACFGSGAHGGAAVAGRSTGAEIYGAGSGPGSATPVENATFRPGWEDIFRMNQKQLEAAVMRVSADPNLEPGRKAYLIQNIMVSRYIVAQQRRMQGKEEGGEGVGTGGSTGSGGSLGCCEVGAGGGVGAAVACGHMGSRVCGGAHVPCSYHDAAKQVLGCKHYKRRAQLVAPCCNKVFPCRWGVCAVFLWSLMFGLGGGAQLTVVHSSAVQLQLLLHSRLRHGRGCACMPCVLLCSCLSCTM